VFLYYDAGVMIKKLEKYMSRFLVLGLLLLLPFNPARAADNQFQQFIFDARDKVLPALVHIQPVIKDYRTGELKKQSVVGSGVIFHPDGYVVTNYHVAGNAERIICTLNDREQVSASYIGGDPPTDLAVIKLDLSGYSGKIIQAEFGNSDSVEVGQQVLAMGSPLSLSRSVSSGVISTQDRYFSDQIRLPTGEPTGRYNLWLQTDAAINPGNSGGPLVDLNGKVIGINSRATFGANNLGFAIPVNIVKEVTAAILEHGKVTRSWIGLQCQALQELEGHFGAGDDIGVLIASIDPGSPAEDAYLKAGDIILAIDSEPVSAKFVEELPAFYSQIARHAPGDEITLKVLREDEEYTFSLRTRELGALQGDDFECRDWGVTVREITRNMRLQYQLRDTAGVFVTGVRRNGPADIASVRSSDVITTINRVPVPNLTEFVEHYSRLVADDIHKVLLQINRNGATRLAVINNEKTRSSDNADEDE